MVGHLHIGMQRAGTGLECFAQPVAIRVIVLLGKKTRFAVVAALDDMERESGKMDAWAAGHGESLAKYFLLANQPGKT
jgi:hypothetical protein